MTEWLSQNKKANKKGCFDSLFYLQKCIFCDLISKLKRFLSSYSDDGIESAAGRAVANFPQEVYDKLVELYTDAFAEAERNYRENGGKNDSAEGGVKYQLRNVPDKETIERNFSEVVRMKSVSTLSGKEFEKSEIDIITQVTNFFDSIGNKVDTSYGTVELTHRGVKSSIAHGIGRNKAVAFAAIPEVLKNGKIIDYQTNWKGRKTDTAVFSAPITIAQKQYYMGCVVEVKKDSNTYYLHEVAIQEKNSDTSFKTGPVSTETPSEVSPLMTLLQKLQFVKSEYTQNSKNNSTRNTEYMSAVESGDVEMQKRLVKEAADEAGYTEHLYHGTKAKFTVFDLEKHGGKNGKGEGYGIYLSSREEISGAYGDRVIDSYVKFNRLAEGSKLTLKADEVKNIIRTVCENEAREAVEDGEYDSVEEALKDSFVSNYVYTLNEPNMDSAYSKMTNILFKGNSNDGDLINEIMAACGANYNYKQAIKFYSEVLTPTTGIDGFHYGDVYLAFDSSQIKSADPITYDDEGNVIPLDERFNSKERDIRYSSRNINSKIDNEVEKYTEKQYNDYGWVAYNGVLTGKELKKLNSSFADIKLNGFKGQKNKNGEYLILVGDEYASEDALVYIKGTTKHPIIRQIIRRSNEGKNLGISLQEIVENETYGRFKDENWSYESYAGTGLLNRYTLSDTLSYLEARMGRGQQDSNSIDKTGQERNDGRGIQKDSYRAIRNQDGVKKSSTRNLTREENDARVVAKDLKKTFGLRMSSDEIAVEIADAYRQIEKETGAARPSVDRIEGLINQAAENINELRHSNENSGLFDEVRCFFIPECST